MTPIIAMDARPGGPPTKLCSRKGWGINSGDDLSAVGAALNPSSSRKVTVTREDPKEYR